MNVAEKVLDMLRTVIGFALEHVPEEEISKVLTEEAIKRQNAVADAAEVGKFGG